MMCELSQQYLYQLQSGYLVLAWSVLLEERKRSCIKENKTAPSGAVFV